MPLRFFVFLSVVIATAVARAQPIVVDVVAGTTPPTAIHVASKDVEGLFDALLSREQEFLVLLGHPFTASVDYLGIPDAFNVSVTGDALSATIRIRYAGVEKTFTAATAEVLQKEVEQWIKQDGAAELAKFRRVVNRRSPAGLTDGNPNATTALLARTFLRAFTLPHPSQMQPFDPAERGSLRSTPGINYWHAGRLSGRQMNLDTEAAYRLNPRWSLSVVLPLNYGNTGGAETFGAGIGSGVAFDLVPATSTSTWRSRTSVFGGSMVRGSQDLAAGGALWSWGASVNLLKQITPWAQAGIVAQGSAFHGIPLDFKGYELDRVVQQQIAKFGFVGRIDLPWLSHGLALQALDTEFVQAAAVQSYRTLGIAYRWESERRAHLQLGYEADRGSHYHSNNVRAEAGVKF